MSGGGPGTNPPGLDYATVKYDAQGNQLWVARYNGPGNGNDRASALTFDGLGNVYVTGYSLRFGTNRVSDYVTIKYDTSGDELWITHYNGPGDGNLALANALTLDGAGNVYVTGFSGVLGGFGGSDYVTIKYAAVPNLRVAVIDQQRTEEGVQITLWLDNTGDANATGVQFTNATLAESEADGLPPGLPDIPANGSAIATLRFAGSFTPGTRVLLRVQGSFNGGTFTASRLVTVP